LSEAMEDSSCKTINKPPPRNKRQERLTDKEGCTICFCDCWYFKMVQSKTKSNA
jgi:hypothetical protein